MLLLLIEFIFNEELNEVEGLINIHSFEKNSWRLPSYAVWQSFINGRVFNFFHKFLLFGQICVLEYYSQ